MNDDRFRALADAFPGAFCALDENGRIEFWGRGGERLFGVAERDALGRSLDEAVPALAATPLEGARPGKYGADEIVFEARPLGDWRLLSATFAPRPEGGAYLFIRDVARSDDATDLLVRRTRTIDRIFDAIVDPVALIRADGRLLNVNSAHAAAFAVDRRELGRRQVVGWRDDAETVPLDELEPAQAALRAGEPRKCTLMRRGADGAERWFDVVVVPLGEEAELPGAALEIARDVTDRLKLDAELRRAQLLDALGTLAGGIAHDFNNIIFGVLGYVELIGMDLPEESAAARNLRQIGRAVERARLLVARIQAFAGGAEPRKERLDLGPLVERVGQMMRAALPATVRILPPQAPPALTVNADAAQLAEAIVALCHNGAEAMGPDGGTLELSLRALDVGAEPARGAGGLMPGRYALIGVSDTGQGIAPANIERIFQPFFTTKGIGEGSGLGLSAASGIIAAHGGRIDVCSEIGRGSTFRIFLPLAAEDRAEAPPLPASRGNERVLLADDQPEVLDFGRQLLERLGYEVEAFARGDAAHDALAAAPRRFHIVVADLAMPGMDGLELARRARALNPDLPVLLTTGFGLRIAELRAAEAGVGAVLAKPADALELARAIRRLLDGARERDERCHESS